jgi:transcriptional regulator with XRE-family HTH domain
MNKFSQRLKDILKDRNMAQAELARKIGMSQDAINNYCTGRREPSLDVLMTICQFFGVSADYLIGLIDY